MEAHRHLAPPGGRRLTRLPAPVRRRIGPRLVVGFLLTPFWLWRARRLGGAGVGPRLRSIPLALRLLRDPACRREALMLLLFPLDSVRHFEIETALAWAEPIAARGGTLLDLSSPRLFPLLLLARHRALRAVLVNPDRADLDETRRWARALRVEQRCRFLPHLASALDSALDPGERFDCVSSLSVIEHIPEPADREAVDILWQRVRPGGSLVLSVPCAAVAFEEWLDQDAYGLLGGGAGAGEFVHGQTFYDEALVEGRILSVTGRAAERRVVGERVAGTHFAQRDRRFADPAFPFWRETLSFAEDYRRFQAIEELPGIGVAALRLRRPDPAPGPA